MSALGDDKVSEPEPEPAPGGTRGLPPETQFVLRLDRIEKRLLNLEEKDDRIIALLEGRWRFWSHACDIVGGMGSGLGQLAGTALKNENGQLKWIVWGLIALAAIVWGAPVAFDATGFTVFGDGAPTEVEP